MLSASPHHSHPPGISQRNIDTVFAAPTSHRLGDQALTRIETQQTKLMSSIVRVLILLLALHL